MSQPLTIEKLCVTAGSSTLLNEVSLTVQAGEFVALVGPNGAGKSTLLKALLGLRPPTSGSASINGRSLLSLSGRERAEILAWLPQHGLVQEPIPVIDLVVAARFRFDEGRAVAVRAAETALNSVNASFLRDRTATTLSGGESQRVALAILRAQEAQILLLDEPANHLDPAQQRTTYKNLGDLWRKGHGLVCVTHDINLLGALERPNEETPIRVIGMGHGELVFDSHYDAPELPELLSDLFGVPFTAVDHAGSRYLLIAGEGR